MLLDKPFKIDQADAIHILQRIAAQIKFDKAQQSVVISNLQNHNECIIVESCIRALGLSPLLVGGGSMKLYGGEAAATTLANADINFPGSVDFRTKGKTH